MTEENNLKRMCAHCDSALPDGAKFCPACGVATGDGGSSFEEAKAFVLNSASEAEKAARDLMKNEDAQKIAGGALVGLAAAVVLPISLATGALIGGGIAAYKRFNK